MANPHPNHHHLAAVPVLLVFLLLISLSPSSAARPLNDFGLAATAPTFNLALPSDGVMPEKEEPAAGRVSPCDHMRVAGEKYGPLILNMLPKGTVPPSGPSKGTNNLNN